MEFNIDNVQIPFSEDYSRIAISLSGGADSALLTYLLCVIASEVNPKLSIHVISHVRCWKTKPWQEYDSELVYQWLYEKFSFFNWKRHVNFISPDLEYGNIGPSIQDEYGKMVSGDNIQIRSYAEYVCHKNNIHAYYNAVTKNPDTYIQGAMIERNITENADNGHLRTMTHMGRHVHHPFRFIDKSWVISQYKKRNLEKLLNITRSCEGTFDNLNYLNYKRSSYVPLCNNCFWCRERSWALKEYEVRKS